MEIDRPLILGFAVALGIGLLVGAERERRKEDPDYHGAAGLRTFALVALIGALSRALGNLHWLAFAIGGLFTVGAALLAYRESARQDLGLTTESALIVTFLLGALTSSEPVLAAALAVVVTILLAARTRLHGWIAHSLSESEFRDALWLLGAALVVLPLAPNRAMGPGGVFNPSTVWRLVVIAMSLQAVGYIALRSVGRRAGLALSGFLSGFVSSTATIGVMGARAKREPESFSGAVAGAVLSNVATVVFVALVVAAASRPVLVALAGPLLAAGTAAALYGTAFTIRALRAGSEEENRSIRGRAFDFKTALVLAATVSLVLALATWLQGAMGSGGALLAAALGGFADAQAPAISASTLAAEARLTAAEGALAALIALSTNSISKLIVAWSTGSRRYALIVSLGVIFVVAAAWGGWLLTGR